MQKCWTANPEDRPSFFDLSGMFGTLLGNQSVIPIEITIFIYKMHYCNPLKPIRSQQYF